MKHDNIHFIPLTASTNLLMKQIADYKLLNNKQLDDFFVICAGAQTAGRGLAENRWESAPNENLLASFYFTLPLPPARQFAFNQCFALAARDLISQYADNVRIKWPNDIYVGDRKIAGILIEHTIVGDRLAQTIAGIGLNVNQTDFSEALPNPISLKQISGKKLPIADLLSAFITLCKARYETLQRADYQLLIEEYRQHLYLLETPEIFIIKGEAVAAKIVGVNDYGLLRLRLENGGETTCGLKEVIFPKKLTKKE